MHLRFVPFYFLPALAFVGCSTPAPSIDAHHPASPTAPEAAVSAPRHRLGADELTQRTHEQIAKRAAEAEAAETAKGETK